MAKRGEPDDRKAPPAPTYDRLYDAAQELGTCEVVVDLTPSGLPSLAIRALSDGRVVHREAVRSTVEKAAARLCKRLEREHAAR